MSVLEGQGTAEESISTWWSCCVFVVSLYGLILVIAIGCPAHLVEGYVCDPLWLVVPNTHEDDLPPHQDDYHKRIKPLTYSLNGFRCFWIIVGGVVVLHWLGYSSTTLFLCQNYARCALISNLLGFVASFYFVYIRFSHLSSTEQKANNFRRAPTMNALTAKKDDDDEKNGKCPPNSSQHCHCLDIDDRGASFFFGKEFNPRWEFPKPFALLHNDNSINGNEAYGPTIFDVKMALYLVGAIVLELNVISVIFYEQSLRGTNSNALLLYGFLMSWFVLDYLWYEEVHLYTYDIFAEKIGFKLVWGCLCFYPFFYSIGTLPFVSSVVKSPEDAVLRGDLTLFTMVFVGFVYLVGSSLTRGANLQKFYFRRYPHKRDVTLYAGMLVLQQETISSSQHRILCSGFWGLARHVNYLGEILQAVALALCGHLYYDGSSVFLRVAPWLYPLYYLALFIPRQLEDEALMRQKYGDKVMNEYIQHVPYRIIPGVY